MTFPPPTRYVERVMGIRQPFPIVTKAEEVLDLAMRRDGFRFKRQVTIKTLNDVFIVDFLVEGWRNITANPQFVVEVRGNIHYNKKGSHKDARKTMELVNAGYPIIWVENKQIKQHLKSVINNLRIAVAKGVKL